MKYVIPFLILILILLAGCQTTNNQKAESFFICKETKTNLIPLSSFKDDVTLVQVLESSYNNSKQKADSIVKISSNEMKIIALADAARVFTIVYDGSNISSEFSPLIPVSKIIPEYIISDIQLIYFPFDVIAKSLPDNVRIIEDEANGRLIREIYCDDNKIIVITYSNKDIFNADVEYKNIERSYSYKITNVES